MRKIINLGLLTSAIIITPLSADTISEAFTNGKIKGEIKALYSNSNFLGNAQSDDIGAIGGNLNFVTGDYYGFKTGVTFQTSSIFTEDNNNSVFKNDVDASGAVLSEAYIDYTISNTNFKIGKQYIYTPLISTALDGKSSESVLKDSFEAYILTNTDIPNTTIVAGYISKYQAKTDRFGDTSDFNKFQDGAYTIYAENTSIENLTLQAQYLNEKGQTSASDKDALYFQANYNLSGHNLSVQYINTTDKTAGEGLEDGEIFGLKATGPIGIGKLGYIVSYNTNTKDGAVYSGAGAGTTDTAFTSIPVNGGGVPTRANTDTLVGGIIIPISTVTGIAYAGHSARDAGLGDVTAMGAIAIYPINKNFLLKAKYEHVETENIFNKDTDVSRIYLSYKF